MMMISQNSRVDYTRKRCQNVITGWWHGKICGRESLPLFRRNEKACKIRKNGKIIKKGRSEICEPFRLDSVAITSERILYVWIYIVLSKTRFFIRFLRWSVPCFSRVGFSVGVGFGFFFFIFFKRNMKVLSS